MKEPPMQTLNLKIDDAFFPHFKAMLDSFVKDKKVEIIENEYPNTLLVSSVEEVQNRVFAAEKRIAAGEFHTQDDYEKLMDKFFDEELGTKR